MTFSGPLQKTARLYEKADQRRKADEARRAVYRAVSLRDSRTCRACGRRCQSTLSAVPDRLEHHHVIPRSLGGPDTTRNIAVICLACHQDRHVTRTLTIEGNADKRLVFTRGSKTWKG